MNGDAAQDPVRRDDELLDALRRGTSPPADDPVAALLAGWHTEIEAHAARLDDLTWHAADAADGQRPPDPAPAAVRLDQAAAEGTGTTPAAGGSPGTAEPAPGVVGSTGSAPRRGRRAGRAPRRVLSGAVLALVLVTGGIWLGSARAEPGGLLWPVTELVWAERAESLVAEREIDRLLDQARRDLGAGRYAEARHDLERATALLVHLGDGRRAVRFRVDIDDLRQRLPAADVPDTPPGGPTPTAPGGTATQETTSATNPAPPGTPATPSHQGAPVSPAATTPAAGTVPPMRTAPARPVRAPASGGHAPAPGGDTGGTPSATRPGRTAPDRPAANPTAGDRAPTRGRPETRAPANGTRAGLPPAAGSGEVTAPAAAAGHPEPVGGRAGDLRRPG